MIVVDTNLLVYLYVAGQRTAQAEAALARDPAWAAPLLWRSEFRNTLVGLIRHRVFNLDGACRIAGEAELMMTGREYTVVVDHALRLAGGSGCSAYDCEFVGLAQDLGVPLVTADRRVLRAFPSDTVALDVFAA